ncbi:MAG TPA: acyl-CoA dehydrogenase family protein [Acidimicrobiales bacterium]
MDFTFTDSQQAIAELAGTILAERCPPEVLRELERDHRTATEAWKALAGADLLGLWVPEDAGGSGLGLLEACLVAEQVGRHVALVPYWPTALAAAAIARWASGAARDRWLPGAVDGTGPLAVALWEPGVLGMSGAPESGAQAAPDVGAPTTVARPDGDGWTLTGRKSPVPWGRDAAAVLVPARVADTADVVLVAVAPDTPGVERLEERPVSGEPTATLVLDRARVGADAVLAAPADGAAALAWLRRRATALLSATALGVTEGALALTARHVTEREQFGSPIGTFQAVAHRCADSYIDTEAIRLTTWQAAWRLDADLPADEALDIAAFWVAEGGQRVVHAAQHLHGGIGVDVDYPVHRYFRWAKVLELLVGGATGSLLRLGRALSAARAGGA